MLVVGFVVVAGWLVGLAASSGLAAGLLIDPGVVDPGLRRSGPGVLAEGELPAVGLAIDPGASAVGLVRGLITGLAAGLVTGLAAGLAAVAGVDRKLPLLRKLVVLLAGGGSL